MTPSQSSLLFHSVSLVASASRPERSSSSKVYCNAVVKSALMALGYYRGSH